MNCDTIDAILDERRSALLDGPARQSALAHLAGCSRCADSWAAHEALASEDFGEPPHELWQRIVARVAEPPPTRRAAGARAWLGALGLAAAAAAAFVAVRAFAPEPGEETDAGAALAAASEPRFLAGRDYFELATPQLDAVVGTRIAVQEFFMYLCFPCYSFEDELVGFDDVALERVPAMFHADARLHARAFYAAEALGKLDEMHAAFYDEVHERGNRLASREALAEFFARFGVNAAEFDAAFDSPDVDARVRRAASLAAEYHVEATPTIVVAGRYVTGPSLAGPNTLAVVEQLVAAEAERQGVAR